MPAVFQRIFTDEVQTRLRRIAEVGKDVELLARLRVLGISAPSPSEAELPFVEEQRQRRRAAWISYLGASDRLGMFAGQQGGELVGRLRSRNAEDFRSAMSECMVAWYLADELGHALTPRPLGRGRRRLEFSLEHENETFVEVKAPRRIRGPGGSFGSDAPLLERALLSANKQFRAGAANVLAIAPELTIPVFSHRGQLIEAFFGKTVLKMEISKRHGGAVGEPWTEFEASGRFLDTTFSDTPRYTRVSAVLCLEMNVPLDSDRVNHNALAVHNPHAAVPVPETIFGGIPQLVQRGNEMVWVGEE